MEKISENVSFNATVVQDRHFAMNDNPVKDDIAFYFMWKSNIDKNELPNPNAGSETVRKLSRRLSIATSISNVTQESALSDQSKELF